MPLIPMVLTGALYDPEARTVQLQLAGMDAGGLPLPSGVPTGRDDLVQVTPTLIVSPPIPLAGRGSVATPIAEYRGHDGVVWRCAWDPAAGAWGAPTRV